MERLKEKGLEKGLRCCMTKEEMKGKGFRYDPKSETYTYRFPVYKYHSRPLIFCKVGVDETTGSAWFNIYDMNDTLYAAYYGREYGVSSIIPVIEKAVAEGLEKLGIKRVDQR